VSRADEGGKSSRGIPGLATGTCVAVRVAVALLVGVGENVDV